MSLGQKNDLKSSFLNERRRKRT